MAHKVKNRYVAFPIDGIPRGRDAETLRHCSVESVVLK